MNAQDEVKTVWELATLDMLPTDCLRDTLWAAAEHEASSMNPQIAANSSLAIFLFFLHGTGSSRQGTGRFFCSMPPSCMKP
jgi:hypothetical protein